MSLLTISKKAITEVDAEGVLHKSCGLHKPLGANAIIIKPDDYLHCCYVAEGIGFAKDIQEANVVEELKSPIDNFLDNTDYWRFSLSTETQRQYLRKHLAGIIVDYLDVSKEKVQASIRLLPHHMYDKPAYHYAPSLYEQPLVSFIVAPASHMSKNLEVYQGANAMGLSLPGYTAQWHTKCLWHEIGHAVGAWEPQADMIAAVILRREFDDQRVIKAAADFRAFKTIFPKDEKRRRKYDLFMTEANDYIMRRPESAINDLTEEQIRNIRFQKFDSAYSAALAVSAQFSQWSGWPKVQDCDYEGIARRAEKLLSGKSLNNVEHRIVARFGLAAARFSIGEEAYNQGLEGIVNSEFLDSEMLDPITFEPGEFVLR